MLNLAESLAVSSFELFCKIILRQKLGEMHKEWIKAAMEKKHLCIMSARGHFKTTILSVSFPLWIMVRDPQPRMFVILSATLEQSTEIMGLIKKKIEENDFLRDILYPDNIHETKWSETQIRTKNGHRVLCLPFGDSVRGKHPDYCICDDVLRSEISSDIENAKKVFYGVVYPTVHAKRGKIIVVGTPISYTDLLADLSKKSNFIFLKYPAVVMDSNGNWLRPQFPEHFDLEQLQTIRDTMPAHLWAREYMCAPISEDTMLFPQDVLEKAISQYQHVKMQYDVDEKAGIKHRVVIGCDIAVSTNPRADWSVFTVLKGGYGKPFLLVDMVRKHLTAEENVREIKKLYEIYKPNSILIERTGVGWGVAEACMKDDEIGHLCRDFDTKFSSRERILSRLEVYMRNGMLAIPKNDVLLEELSTFAYKKMKDGRMAYQCLGEHDDCVMSLAIALEAGAVSSYSSITLI